MFFRVDKNFFILIISALTDVIQNYKKTKTEKEEVDFNVFNFYNDIS